MTVELRAVSPVLGTIDAPPGLRTKPIEGDLQGAVVRLFDGGAIKIVTGRNEYHFAEGTLDCSPAACS